MPSFLERLDHFAVVRKPFPHVCIENLLDDDLARRLSSEIPALETFANGRTVSDNQKLFRRAPDLLADPGLTPSWRQIIADHVNPQAFWDLVQLFQDDIAREFPDLSHELLAIGPSDIGIRGRDSDCRV